MAFTTAQLAAALSANGLTVTLQNISGSALPAVGAVPLAIGVPTMIDSEVFFTIAQPVTNTFQIRGRGSDGTAAVAHDVLANVIASSTGDFPAPFAGSLAYIDPTEDLVLSVGQDQTLLLPTVAVKNTIVNINKATAIALTVPAPAPALNGLQLTITSTTAAAHVITATALLMDGTAGAPKTTATFAASKGATMLVVAENGLWNVVALQNVTLS